MQANSPALGIVPTSPAPPPSPVPAMHCCTRLLARNNKPESNRTGQNHAEWRRIGWDKQPNSHLLTEPIPTNWLLIISRHCMHFKCNTLTQPYLSTQICFINATSRTLNPHMSQTQHHVSRLTGHCYFSSRYIKSACKFVTQKNSNRKQIRHVGLNIDDMYSATINYCHIWKPYAQVDKPQPHKCKMCATNASCKIQSLNK